MVESRVSREDLRARVPCERRRERRKRKIKTTRKLERK